MSHRWCYFNPRTHEECDRLLVKLVNRMLLFQSTHSRGVRHHSPNKHPPTRYFNPRTHEECDSSPPSHSLDDNNFNPRTHEECDLSGWGDLMALSDFNPRTHEECDSLADRHYIRNYDFNPRTHEECDVHPKCVCQFADLFQSTHSRGVRLGG